MLPKYFRADRASKVIEVILLAESIYMWTSEGLIALCTKQVKSLEIICLTEYPYFVVFVLQREEFVLHLLVAVLEKLAGKRTKHRKHSR